MSMNSNIIILILGTIVITTYILDYLSHKIKIPSVLFLILIGLIFRLFADKTGFELPFVEELIPILGTIALILIVLEGGLDLELRKDKVPVISKSLISSIILMFISAFSIAATFYYVYGQSFYVSLINAIPLSVISSAIAIPSVKGLDSYNRDFVVYESTFSDILGIMFFNFVLVISVVTF